MPSSLSGSRPLSRLWRLRTAATHPDQRRALHCKLGDVLLATPLFDLPRFVTHLEDAYLQMWEQYERDAAPSYIWVEPHGATTGHEQIPLPRHQNLSG